MFVPENFKAPVKIVSEFFYICPLNPVVAEQDYEAVMSCHNDLKGIFGPNYDWPSATMTFEQSKDSLLVHEQEFDANQAFAYAVFDSNKEQCLGSIYIDPCKLKEYDCEVYYWIRSDKLELESQLCDFVENWLKKDWPFKQIIYPGRNITWLEWQQLHS